MTSDDFDEAPIDDLPTDEQDAARWNLDTDADGRHRRDVLGAIALGGVIGATARFALTEAMPVSDGGFPVATLSANVVGSFLLGLIAVASVELWAPMRYLRPFLAVGLIGSFTTFSAFAVEGVLLVDGGDLLVAAIYVPTMLAAGLCAARVGIGVGRRLAGSASRS